MQTQPSGSVTSPNAARLKRLPLHLAAPPPHPAAEKGEAPAPEDVPEAAEPATRALRIDGFVRPFTERQVWSKAVFMVFGVLHSWTATLPALQAFLTLHLPADPARAPSLAAALPGPRPAERDRAGAGPVDAIHQDPCLLRV